MPAIEAPEVGVPCCGKIEAPSRESATGKVAAKVIGQIGADAPSDVWFALSERLRLGTWLLGSATHCLREWAEPSDDLPDVDDHTDPSDANLSQEKKARRRSRRHGRRNVLLWKGAES